MKFNLFIVLFLFLSNCAHYSQQTTNSYLQKPLWIQQSDKLAEEFTKSLSALQPELGSEMGYTEFDRFGLLLSYQTEELNRKLFIQWIERLNKEITQTFDEDLKTDLSVLKNWLQNQINNIDNSKSAQEVEFVPAVKFIYQSLQTLINPQTSIERKQASVDRFKIYVQGDNQHLPLLEAIRKNFQARLKKYKGLNPLLPYIGEVQQYLKDTDTYVAGIEKLLKSSGRSDWNTDLKKFKKQSFAYNKFIKKEILSHSRKDPRVPINIYTQILKRRGIVRSPEELISTGLNDYQKLYQKFYEQARMVANKNGFKKTTPAEVIKILKSQPVKSVNEVEVLYRNADKRLEKIMIENDLISVPTSALRIRIASEAESKAVPVPHLIPPPLINNHGTRPEFVVPNSSVGIPFDDFSSSYAAIVLTAHEGRPGHDMQFSHILDKGVSAIRSRYAANNVNIEGWALYAEDLVYPYLTSEEQLFAIQTRLWRIARMFLDPQLQLGQISDQRVIDVFTKELGVSTTMANLELRRYKYDDIGQAPS
ncbi:MAG: DUF885 domain-containing protein, partial [Bdellovibrionaceae bacterium]|nr:DUF885 domain-containing protein [Pseudobdellovibrionaceae bacterium]